MNALTTLSDGQHYIQVWPLKKELGAMFPENNIITATKLGLKVMPALAALTLALQVQFGDYSHWPAAISIALLFVTLPAQGLFWLGKRSGELLPVSLASWYHELHQSLLAKGCELSPAVKKPRYKELAEVLSGAFKRMDKAFITK